MPGQARCVPSPQAPRGPEGLGLEELSAHGSEERALRAAPGRLELDDATSARRRPCTDALEFYGLHVRNAAAAIEVE